MTKTQISTKHIIFILLICFGFYLISELGASRHQFWWLWCLALIGVQFFGRLRSEIVAFLSIGFHFILDPISLDVMNHLHSRHGMQGAQLYVVHFVSMLVALWIVAMVFRYGRDSWLFKGSYSHYRFLGLYFLMIGIFTVLPSSLPKSLGIYLLMLIGRFIWPLSYHLLNKEKAPPPSLFSTVRNVGLMAPFWSYMLYYLPIPTGVQILESKKIISTEIEQSLKRALKACYWALGMYIVHNAAVVLIFGIPQRVIPIFNQFNTWILSVSLKLPDFYTSLSVWNQSELKIYEKALTIWGRDLLFVLELFPTFGVAIVISKAFGFQLPRMIYRPLQAKTFIQYMGSFLYYYRQFLVHLFFDPLLDILRKQSGWLRRNSAAIAIFGAIVAGGFLFHLNRDVLRLGGSFAGAIFLKQYFNVLPYFLGIGLLASISRRRVLPLYQPLRILLYFSIHPIIIFGIMTVTRFKATLLDYYNFLLNLWTSI